MPKKQENLYIRFWSKVNIINNSKDCWMWLAGKSDKRPLHDYGAFWYKGQRYHAHKIAWFLTYNFLPDPKQNVCHTCDNPPCVNPAHLFIGTFQENMQDKIRKGRHLKKKSN